MPFHLASPRRSPKVEWSVRAWRRNRDDVPWARGEPLSSLQPISTPTSSAHLGGLVWAERSLRPQTDHPVTSREPHPVDLQPGLRRLLSVDLALQSPRVSVQKEEGLGSPPPLHLSPLLFSCFRDFNLQQPFCTRSGQESACAQQTGVS